MSKGSRRNPTRKVISHGELRRMLHYDAATGVFTRLVARRGFSAGSQAGGLDPTTGYICIRIDGVQYLAHRLAWFYVYGVWPDPICDHRNQNRADNRLENLRQATSSQNLINSKMWSNNTSGVKGVSLSQRGKWVAEIRVMKKKVCLGTYENIEDAAAARRTAELKYFGEFSSEAA